MDACGHVALCDLIDSDFYARFQQHAAYFKPFQGYGNFATCSHLLCKNTNFFLLIFGFSFFFAVLLRCVFACSQSMKNVVRFPLNANANFSIRFNAANNFFHKKHTVQHMERQNSMRRVGGGEPRRWHCGTVARRIHRYAKLPSVTQQKSYWRQRVQALSPIFLLFSPFHSFALVRFYK